MISIWLFYFFLLGLIVGSFLNVVILRYNTGRSLAGRSGCFSCRHRLSWYELIPVVSFFGQHGRCRHCGSKISWQYPLVELLTGLLFALSVWRFFPSWSAVIFSAVISSLLLVIVVYDLRHGIIADGPTFWFVLLAILSPFFLLAADVFSLSAAGEQIFFNLLAGFTFFAAFFLLWYLSRGRAIGFGDAKLAFGLGAILGFQGGLNALMWAFWWGAIVGLALIFISRLGKKGHLGRKYSIKSEIPFAPFLALGFYLFWFFGWALFLW